jgi:Fe-S cluster assembly protein SufD
MTSTLTTPGFSQETFDSFLAARAEPDWLLQMRRDAWSRFTQLPMPSAADEEWARTDIRALKLDQYDQPNQVGQFGSADSKSAEEGVVPRAILAAGVQLSGHAAYFNGRLTDRRLDSAWQDRGVLFGSLDQLVAEHGRLLRPYLERRVVDPHQDKFSALSAAFWSGGTLLYVPKGVCIDQPLHSLSALAAGGTDISRTLVILAEGAEATLLAETASVTEGAGSTSDRSGLHCSTMELIVEKDASLRYVNLQNWDNRVWHFAHQRAEIGQQGRLQWTIGALGSRLAKVNQRVALTGSDAEAQVNGVMFTQGRQHLCYNTHQHHLAPHCRSDLLYKTALQDTSRTVWRGMIQVDPEAQRTDGYQRNDNLMLSARARADSIPGLEIEADDVRCTHGSTSGRVDDGQLFYAMSRGFSRQEAVRMIVAGFFQQIFDRISIESVRDALGEAIGRRVQDLKHV